jgi:hypothetical protein
MIQRGFKGLYPKKNTSERTKRLRLPFFNAPARRCNQSRVRRADPII